MIQENRGKTCPVLAAVCPDGRYDLAMSRPVTWRPTICLNMIVKNEAHIIHECLDSVAPFISSWVIVDTGSDDGTPDVIRRHMDGLGLSGELHERPWRNFGHNRSEALRLAQGHGDYIWVMDADDTLVGTPDLSRLSNDVYSLRLRAPGIVFWRPLLFRDGLPLRYEGVVHEYLASDTPCAIEKLEGDYYIDNRHLGGRNLDDQKYIRDRDLLLAEVRRNPADPRSVFYLAQTYFCLQDWVSSRDYYARRIELGGWDEEVFYSMMRVAESMAKLGAPWPDVQDAYLKAWEFRQNRAEPLYAIARHYLESQRHALCYQFARLAAEIPYPEQDKLFVDADIYAWRAADDQAASAFFLGKHTEAFTLWRGLLARPELPEGDRQRIAGNRDAGVPAMIEEATRYPEGVAHARAAVPADGRAAEVVVSLVAGPDAAGTEQTLNSFLNCCADLSRVGRFVVVDAGLTAADRTILQRRYEFLEGFLEFTAAGAGVGQIREQIHARFWLQLGSGWRFFAPEKLITRLTGVLKAEPQVFQVGVNFADAATLTGTCAAEQVVRRTPDAGRYVLTDSPCTGPAMVDIARLDRAAGMRTASLDEVLCIT
jgi:glycosyltransferase involved in cell wall biosynthesis